MKVAVTGASGFIGRSLCTALSASGHEVLALNLRTIRAPLDLAGAGALVHLAALVHSRGQTPANFRQVNVDLTQLVGRAAAAAGARMIFVSSVKVHGEGSKQVLKESSPLAPTDFYAQSKAEAEVALRSIAGLQLVVLRPPLVYGPAVKANFLNLMKAIAWGLPLPLALISNRRSLVYVGNLADAILRCVANPRALGRTYLVSDGVTLSTPALCRAIGAALGRPARLFPFPPAWLPGPLSRSLEIDDSALRTELHWSAPFSVEEAMRATADWYRTR
jgi:nucleoside-diphosphate-sugar epimerase